MKIEKPTIQKFIGLDLSLTSTGVCSFITNPVALITRVIKTSNKLTYAQRYNKIIESILSEYSISTITSTFIEGYSFGSFGKSSSMSYLIELGGILKFKLYREGINYVIVPPTLLKKFISGKGTSKKEDIKLHIYKKYGQEFESSDAADAYALVAMGVAYDCGKSINGKNLTSAEIECISRLREMNRNDA